MNRRLRSIVVLLVAPLGACGLSVVGDDAGVAPPAVEDAGGAVGVDAATPPDAAKALPADAAPGDSDAAPGMPVLDAGPDTGPPAPLLPTATFTPANGVTLNPSPTSGACSLGGAFNPQITLTNDGTSPLVLLWVRTTDCVEVAYQDVAPTATASQPTYRDHRWRIRRKSDNALISDFTMGQSSVKVTVR